MATTHWSVHDELHTGTVDDCAECNDAGSELEGCPDCGGDTLTVDADGAVSCSRVTCGWRP